MFKNFDFYIKTRCTQSVGVFFPEQECNLVTCSVCMTKSSFITGKIVESAQESV